MNPFTYGGIVEGKDFCNRTREFEEISRAMKNGERLFVYAERRTGKTSLVLRAAKGLPPTFYLPIYIDLWATSDEHTFAEAFARAVTAASETRVSKILESAKMFFGRFSPALTVDSSGKPLLKFEAGNRPISERDLVDILSIPEILAKKKKKNVVIIFDEFQRIADYADDTLERQLRSIIQHHRHVSYIFLGSRRHVIQKLFLNSRSPLYRSAGHYPLDMISLDHWNPFIAGKFRRTGKKISSQVIASLVALTEGHPFYTQHLAHALWDNTEKGKEVTEKNLSIALETVLTREHFGYSGAWELLTPTQRRLLLSLADPSYPSIPLFSTEFARTFNFRSVSTVQRAIAALMEKDFIDQSGNQFIILDRFFKRWLQRISQNNR
ncbi:MAG: ATP-binding protein [Candidatus Kapaibacterium sp.]